MGGSHQPSGPPTAYSTRTIYDQDHGWHTDGHKVVIDPHTLQQSVDFYKNQLQGKNANDLHQTLTDTMQAAAAFGKIPNSDHAMNELQKFIDSHVQEMAKMQDGTLVEFVARVQAAADLGYESDPATRAAAARGSAGHPGME